MTQKAEVATSADKTTQVQMSDLALTGKPPSDTSAHDNTLSSVDDPLIQMAGLPDQKENGVVSKNQLIEQDQASAETKKFIESSDAVHTNMEYADLWARIRSGMAIPNLASKAVRSNEARYARSQEYLDTIARRASLYLFYIVEEIERRGMPTELALLPIIESAFDPKATSRAKAAGMWQFIPSTGKSYDLDQNIFRDERRGVIASTNAALDYLSKLYDMFGDWHLALAAYNAGENAVKRAQKRNKNKRVATDFAALPLPRETRNYVPRFQAIKNIVMDPEKFNLTLLPIFNRPYFTTVKIERDIDITLISELAGISVEEFKLLNPSHKRPVILAATNAEILLPFEEAEKFQQALSSYQKPTSQWKIIRLNQSKKTSELAKIWSINEAHLRQVNGIPRGRIVQAGSALFVPRSAHDQDASAAMVNSARLILSIEQGKGGYTVYTVRRGDTLSEIAERFRISIAQIKVWNKLKSNRIRIGQRLKLHTQITLRNLSKNQR